MGKKGTAEQPNTEFRGERPMDGMLMAEIPNAPARRTASPDQKSDRDRA